MGWRDRGVDRWIEQSADENMMRMARICGVIRTLARNLRLES